jgi:hypothetical protein
MTNPPDFVLFVGRFHPLLVHLPIGFLVVLAALEVFERIGWVKGGRSAIQSILALLVPASLASAACGWLLSQGGGYDPVLLQRHQWSGFAVAGISAVLWFLHRCDRMGGYRAGLAAALVVLTVASHWGGSLTHGSDYLLRYAPGPLRALLAPGSGMRSPAQSEAGTNEASVYAAVIHPIMDKYCLDCHSPEKAKGRLRLDSVAAMLTGGKEGPGVIPGKAEDSVVIKRLMLPLDDDDRMPPQGKPQPGADDVALLRWWINAGARPDKTAADLRPPADLQRFLDQRLGRP